jgi:hypothetical protein
MPLRFRAASGVVFAGLLTALAAGPSPAAETAEDVLVKFGPKVDAERVRPHEAEVSAVQRGEAWTLAVATRASSGWSGVTLRPDGKTWNLADREGVAVEVRNTGSRAATVYVQVENAKAGDRQKSNVGLAHLAPGATAPVRVPFAHYAPKVEGVELFGMRGYPVAAKGDVRGRMDASRVTGVRIHTLGPEAGTFEVAAVRAYGAARPQPEARLTAETFFPFIDTFGQYVHRDWPGKTHSEADMAAARTAEADDLARHPGPGNWNRWGGWADGPEFDATGFFRPVRHEGRWFLVDPEGRLFFSHGIDCVRHTGATPLDDRDGWWRDFPGDAPEFKDFFGRTGHVVRDYYKGKHPRTFDVAMANARRKYGEDWREQAAAIAHRRLRSWGLNTIGNWSDADIYLQRKTPYVATVSFRAPPIEGSQGYWGKFKDPFHPDFEKNLNASMERERGRTAGDPFCLGYFVDNEIAWGNETSLAEAALASPPDQPAKRAFLADLQKKYRDIDRLNKAWGTAHASWDALATSTKPPDAKRAGDDLRAFYTRLAERYFRLCRGAVKRVAPKQMYLGCRFAWVNDRAARAAAPACDVVSYNRYQRSVAGFRLPDGVDAPVIIGEFHFGALDRGLFHTGLVPVASQEARAEAYKTYVRSAVAHPQIVGCHWFKYKDQSTIGRALDGENYQIGFLDICDTPYPETIAACREVGYALYPPPGHESAR